MASIPIPQTGHIFDRIAGSRTYIERFAASRRMVPYAVEQDDFTQEALLLALRWSGTFNEDRAGLSTWLTYVIKKTRTDILRSRNTAKRGGGEFDLSLEYQKARGATSLLDLLRTEDEHFTETFPPHIELALLSLTPKEHDLIHRRFVQQETLAEVGAAWGVTRERARQIEQKAIGALREFLTEHS